MAESLAKPSVNPLEVTYTTGTGMPIDINVIGLQVQVQGELEDVTSGADTSRRLAKTGLVQGRILVTGYMATTSVFELLRVINNDSGLGDNITLKYGDAARSKVFTGYLEGVEMNSNKTRPYVGVAVSFRLCGAQNDTVT
jgi:hypothetical protein